MRDLMTATTGALFGALLAVVIVFSAASHGLLPGRGTDTDIHAYLMAHPELVQQMTDRLQARQQAEDDAKAAAAVKKVGMASFFDPKLAFVTGPADAKKTLVEFYDYDCPFCRASLPAMMKYYDAHKNDTRFSFIEFPIPQLHGPGADLAAMASLAARRQPDKYIALHFALMGQEGSLDEKMIYDAAAKAGLDLDKLKADMKDPAIAEALAASKALAHRAGIDGTPTFIINGVLHAGAVDDEALAQLVKES
jgi:protein-disulfide isomerase